MLLTFYQGVLMNRLTYLSILLLISRFTQCVTENDSIFVDPSLQTTISLCPTRHTHPTNEYDLCKQYISIRMNSHIKQGLREINNSITKKIVPLAPTIPSLLTTSDNPDIAHIRIEADMKPSSVYGVYLLQLRAIVQFKHNKCIHTHDETGNEIFMCGDNVHKLFAKIKKSPYIPSK